jgi:hypothetical protein
MTAPPSISVYIACQRCKLVYLTKQTRVPLAVIGRFDCVERQPVHSWSGTYDYVYWKPVARRT